MQEIWNDTIATQFEQWLTAKGYVRKTVTNYLQRTRTVFSKFESTYRQAQLGAGSPLAALEKFVELLNKDSVYNEANAAGNRLSSSALNALVKFSSGELAEPVAQRTVTTQRSSGKSPTVAMQQALAALQAAERDQISVYDQANKERLISDKPELARQKADDAFENLLKIKQWLKAMQSLSEEVAGADFFNESAVGESPSALNIVDYLPVAPMIAIEEKPDDTMATEDELSAGEKIGRHIRQKMRELADSGYQFSEKQINDCCTEQWSHEKLALRFIPFFRVIAPGTSDLTPLTKDQNGHIRYWGEVFTFGDKKVLITKEWYERSREPFDTWYATLIPPVEEEPGAEEERPTEHVRHKLLELSGSGYRLSQKQLYDFCNPRWSKDTFCLYQPFAVIVPDHVSDPKELAKDKRGRYRYWSKDIFVFNEIRLLFNSQWYDSNIPLFDSWYETLSQAAVVEIAPDEPELEEKIEAIVEDELPVNAEEPEENEERTVADISPDQVLRAFEQNLTKRLRHDGIEIWSDISCTQQEYSSLTKRINEALPEKFRLSEYYKLFAKYPVCCTTQIVFFVYYEYQDEFWSPWATTLCIKYNINLNGEIGKRVLKQFDRFGFQYATDGYTYRTPVQQQAGIPNDDLVGLFYALDIIGLSPEMAYEELMATRMYLLHKPVQRFFTTYGNRAIALLSDIYDTMHGATGNQRLVEAHEKWKEVQKQTGQRRSSAESVPRPYLYYADDGRGLCLLLPSVEHNDAFASKLTWQIKFDADKPVTYEAPIAVTSTRRYSRELGIPAKSFKKASITLEDDIGKKLYPEAVPLEGFKVEAPFLVFDATGHCLRGNYLPEDFCYLLTAKTYEPICNDCDCEFDEFADTEGYNIYYITIANSGASVQIGNVTLRSRQKTTVALEGGRRLFNDAVTMNNVPIYTQLPQLALTIGQTAIAVNRSSGEQQPYSQSLPYGTYNLRVTENHERVNSLNICYAPAIEYDDSLLQLWPSKHSNTEETGFSYRCPAGCSIALTEGCRSQDKTNGWKDALANEVDTNIVGTLRLDHPKLEVLWKKRVRNLTWSLWQGEGYAPEQLTQTKTINLTDFKKNLYMLSITLSENVSNPKLSLNQQQKDARFRNDRWVISMGEFYDSLVHTRLPADLILSFAEGGNERQVALLRFVEEVSLPDLRYQYKSHPVITWKAHESLSLPASAELVSVVDPSTKYEISFAGARELRDFSRQCLDLHQALPVGIYTIEAKAREDDTLFGAERSALPKLDGQNILIAERKTLEERLETLIDILLQAIIVKTRKDEKRWELLIGCDLAQVVPITDEACVRLLAALICNFDQNRSEQWIKLLQQMSLRYFDGSTRALLLRGLLELALPDAQFIACYNALCLNLVSFKSGEQLPSMPQVHEFFPEDELLFQLQAHPNNLDLHRVELLLGEDAFAKDIDWKAMFGKTCDFYEMYNWELFYKEFNRAHYGKEASVRPVLRPENSPGGLYFAGSSYVDLLVRWERKTPEFIQCHQQVSHMSTDMEQLAKRLERDYPSLYQRVKGRDFQRGFYTLFHHTAIASVAYVYGIDNNGTAEQYLVHMTRIFPELVRRDLLLCEWMIYKKERASYAAAPAEDE